MLLANTTTLLDDIVYVCVADGVLLYMSASYMSGVTGIVSVVCCGSSTECRFLACGRLLAFRLGVLAHPPSNSELVTTRLHSPDESAGRPSRKGL